MNTSTLKLRSTGKKLIVILILSMFSGLSAKNNKKDDIIPGASYVVLENACVTGGVRMPCRYAEYYTFDGKLIKIITNDREDFLDYAQKKIDPKAPKPRPAKYKTIYDSRWIPLIVTPSYWFVLYDKHGNIIFSNRYYGPKNPTKNDIASYDIPLNDKYKFKTEILNGDVYKRLDQLFDLSIITQEIEKKAWYKVW